MKTQVLSKQVRDKDVNDHSEGAAKIHNGDGIFCLKDHCTFNRARKSGREIHSVNKNTTFGRLQTHGRMFADHSNFTTYATPSP